MRVFISYRRDDSMVTAALLYRELTSRPEFADAFMDIDDIGYGDDFVAAIDRALRDADVVVVVIGPKWAEMLQARLRGDDWVRHEVATALRLRDASARPGRAALRVLPVLIGGATPPAASALPADLAPLARLGMLKFDERALKESVNSVLEALQGEEFERRVRRLEEERRKLEEERVLLESERKRRTRARVASVGVALALFLAASLTLLDVFGVGPRVATATMLLARLAAPAPQWSGEVVVVGIDEASERAIGRAFASSWRDQHAIVIERAASAGARIVAFDLVFEEPSTDAADAALERALAATRDTMPVVFGVQSHSATSERGAMLARFEPLARAGIACAGIQLGQAQSMPLAVSRPAAATASTPTSAAVSAAPASPSARTRAGDAAGRDATLLPWFGLAAYSRGGRVELVDEGDRTVLVRVRTERRTDPIAYFDATTLDGPQPGCDVLRPGDRVFAQIVDPFDIPPRSTMRQGVAYERVVAGDPAALAALKDRIVVVGSLRAGDDIQPLPWPADDRPGVELHAAQIDAMVRKVTIRPIPRFAEWALMTALALLGATVGHRLRERSRTLRIAVIAAISVAWIALAIAWYRIDRQLIAVPYDIAALALGAWLANRPSRRPPA